MHKISIAISWFWWNLRVDYDGWQDTNISKPHAFYKALKMSARRVVDDWRDNAWPFSKMEI